MAGGIAKVGSGRLHLAHESAKAKKEPVSRTEIDKASVSYSQIISFIY